MENLFFDNRAKMPCYLTDANDLEIAEREYERRFANGNVLNKSTVYDRKESRMAGILGEVIFSKLYKVTAIPKDLTIDYEYNGHKVDVKCKMRKVEPRTDFEASFFAYQATSKFNADMYFFASTTEKMDKVWLCGFATKAKIMNHPEMVLWKAGEVDERNGMQFKKDTICIPYRCLNRVDMFGILELQ